MKTTITLLLIALLHLHYSTQLASAISCYCNVCPPSYNDTCITSPHSESVCFKSVERLVHKENGTYYHSATYGCFSGGDNVLGPLQCHVNLLRHKEPRFISCCKNYDLCNEDLPWPNRTDDPRWDEPGEPTEETPYPAYDYRLYGYIAIVSMALCMMLYGLVYMISNLVGKCSRRSTKESRGSICSLKADLDQHVASSSASTQSYSISDDLCKKLPDQSNEHSFLPEDLTSGLGERMLVQRTMARAVGFGKTDHVGNGRFGRVFRGQYHGEDVAVKAFRTIDQDSWKREDDIFRTLNHDNIVRFIASEVTSLDNASTEIWMFLEYCPYGSLCDYLDHNEVLGPQQAVKILYSIINGLNYLHEDYAQASRLYKPSIAHRDIKSKNILMKHPDCCCIADFGHALIKINEDTLDYGKYQHLQVGTIRYMAPEILRPNTSLNYRHFSTFAQADLYQYGLILWEVCNRTALDILHPANPHKLPYDGVVPPNPHIQDMIKIVCDDQYRPPRYDRWEKYPMMKRLTDLMKDCWWPNPKARMETLGVKKKLKEMFDQMTPSHIQHQQYQLNLHNNLSLSWSTRMARDKIKSSDVTL